MKITNKNGKELMRFTVRLLLYAVPFFLLVLTGYQITQLMNLTHSLSVALLNATAIPVTVEGNLITVPVEGGRWAAYVSWDSSGWKGVLVLFALIMATGVSMKKRLYGLLLLPALYAINIVRIWFMFFLVYNHGLEHYNLVHSTLWSWGLITALLAIWLLWLQWATGKKLYISPATNIS